MTLINAFSSVTFRLGYLMNVFSNVAFSVICISKVVFFFFSLSLKIAFLHGSHYSSLPLQALVTRVRFFSEHGWRKARVR